jgi:hypothetical protein
MPEHPESAAARPRPEWLKIQKLLHVVGQDKTLTKCSYPQVFWKDREITGLGAREGQKFFWGGG